MQSMCLMKCLREMCGNCRSYDNMVVGYCRMTKISKMDKWLNQIVEQKFVVDIGDQCIL